MFDRSSSAFVGAAGLRPHGTDKDVRELGVHIGRPFWGDAWGEEAARAVIGFAFQTLELGALVAGHHPDNVHSKALIRRLGFVYMCEEPWGPLDLMHPFYRLEP